MEVELYEAFRFAEWVGIEKVIFCVDMRNNYSGQLLRFSAEEKECSVEVDRGFLGSFQTSYL